MICLMLLFALISICQSLINGNMNCTLANNYTDVNNHDICDTEGYKSAERIEEYGVDCCIKEAQDNMIDFSKILQKINLDDAVSTIVENLLMWTSLLLLQRTLLQNSTVCTSNQLSKTQKKTQNQLLSQFSSTCKRYTDVMALKHLLQCHLFSSSPKVELTSKLTEIIINLQTAAIKLQKMQVSCCYLDHIVSKLVVLLCSRQSTPKVHVLNLVLVSINTSIQQLGLMN